MLLLRRVGEHKNESESEGTEGKILAIQILTIGQRKLMLEKSDRCKGIMEKSPNPVA